MKTIKTSYKTSELLSNRLKKYHTENLKRTMYNVRNNNYYFNTHIKKLLCKVRKKKTIRLTASQYMLLSRMINEIIDCNQLALSSLSVRKSLKMVSSNKLEIELSKQVLILKGIIKEELKK